MLLHDILKIKYVKFGYIKKNYPYHLISDQEMFNAFIDLGDQDFNTNTTVIDPNVRFFDILYPNPFTTSEEDKPYRDTYVALKAYIIDTINDYLAKYGTENEVTIPNWIYTYMLGEVVYNQSDYLDIQDTLELLGCSNLDNTFTKDACRACYKVSSGYISTLTADTRPPTIFGEPHVIKRLRMTS